MKKVMAKITSVFLAVVLACSVTACSGSGSSSSTSGSGNSAGNASAKKVNLSMAFWADQSEIDTLNNLLATWKAQHPNVNLNFTYCAGPDYPTKLQVWFSSNQIPDVIRMSRDIFSPFLDQGVFADLTPYVEKAGIKDKWSSNLLDIFTYKNQLLSLPYLYSIYAMAYNKNIFDKAHILYPTASWTEDDFVKLCQELTSGSGASKTYGVWMGGWVCEIIRALYGQPKMYDVDNKKMTATNNPKFKDAFKLLGDIHKNGWCSNEVTKTTTTGGFITGKYAMALTMAGDIKSYQTMIGNSFKWDVVELPISQKYNTRWNANIRLQGFSMSKATKNPDLAFDLVKFMTTDLNAQKNAEVAGIPALTEYTNSDTFKTNYGGGLPYNKDAFVNMSKVAQSWEFAGVWADVNDTLTSEFNAYITNKESLDTAINNIQQKGEAILAKSK